MSRIFLVFAAAFVALMAGALFYAARIPVQQAESAPVAEPVPTGRPAVLPVVTHPEFTLPDVEGVPREFTEWDGKKRILNFWATWCGPCKREIPVLKAFQDEHGDDGFQIIGIAVDFPEEVAWYAKSAEFNYPILVGEQDAMAIAESSGIMFGAMPFTMFVSHEGEYLNAYIGELHEEQLDKVVTFMNELESGLISTNEAKEALGFL